ncbi:MAG: hypothetical protein QFF03_15465 [Pseudomonadota bacterium]|nr:hypothetical protein [Pseudomonadota bacterium]
MKSLTLRSSVAFACALSLAACGGGGGNLSLSGTVYGLVKDGLVLQNNGGTPYPVSAGTAVFVFPQLLKSDEDFNVTIKSSPSNAVCTVTNGKGRTGAYNISSVVVTCITNTYDLGGTISGDATGLVLVNGADKLTVTAGQTSFKFNKVADGSPYGVTVLSQPTSGGRTCSLQNGVGTMGAAAVNNIQVTCL